MIPPCSDGQIGFVERAIKEALVYRAVDGWGTVSIIMRAVSTPQTDHRLIQLQLTSTEPEEEHIREICTHTDHGKQPNAPKLLHLLSPPPAASTWMLLHRLLVIHDTSNYIGDEVRHACNPGPACMNQPGLAGEKQAVRLD